MANIKMSKQNQKKIEAYMAKLLIEQKKKVIKNETVDNKQS